MASDTACLYGDKRNRRRELQQVAIVSSPDERKQPRFQYVFFAYGTSIIGWTNCRSVIMVDAIFFKAKYRGVLMIAMSKDENNNIFPLAFGIADSKNNESYNWFFNQLRYATELREKLSILSYRHPSIANIITNVYPECQHGICIYHKEKNLRKRYFSDVVLSLFYNAATAYKRTEFYTFIDEIEKVNKGAVEYLNEEEPERWARSFHTNRRYNMLTTNNVESMNVVLRKSRLLPILGLIDYIHNKLKSLFYERKMKSQGNFHDITRWAKVEVTDKIQVALKLKVDLIDSTKFVIREEKVEYIVDLKSRTCQCLVFQIDEIPCTHAIAAIESRHMNKLAIVLIGSQGSLDYKHTREKSCQFKAWHHGLSQIT
ncbi:uncharacterized protein LOC107859281 [Capsicum annuum]|uniref:uncharacterized protein LOC107859281 n=1 Tax=Capsicum annuum TaxID=4072 RepID=UPI001FB170FE|nr:uncharacterized protein LOC107859281 [Capsicum annuum]